MSKQGELVERRVRIPVRQPERLVTLLERYRPLEVVVETCPSWPWIYDLLVPAGFGFVLAHAKRLKALAESHYKTDRLSAELLARMHLAGLIPAVYPKSGEQREHSVLVRHRAGVARERTVLVNRIHGQLHAVGLRLERGRLLTRAGRQWLREVAWHRLSPEARRLVRTHLELIRTLTAQMKALDGRVEQVAAGVAAARLLQTIPGIGAYRARVIASEVLPIERFAAPKHLVSYAGLAPRSHKTGLMKRPRYGSLPAGANRWLRGTLVRAVVGHVQHAPTSWLSLRYQEERQRLGWPTARIAAARRLARAIHAMLRTGERWRNELEDVTARGELPQGHVATGTTVSPD